MALALESAGCKTVAEFGAMPDNERDLWLGRARTRIGEITANTHPPEQ